MLGSKRKTPLEALLFGSTSVAVARRARCAVVVVRHGSGSAPVGATSDGPAPWAAGRARDAARNAVGWWDLR